MLNFGASKPRVGGGPGPPGPPLDPRLVTSSCKFLTFLLQWSVNPKDIKQCPDWCNVIKTKGI